MMNRTATIPFIWERDETSLNDNAIRILNNDGIKHCFILQKLSTLSEGKWFPVQYRKTGEYVEGDPIWEVTFRF